MTDTMVRETFDRDGCVVFERLLTPAECDAMIEETERVLDAVRADIRADGGDPYEHLASGVYVGLAVRSPKFAEWVGHVRLVEALRTIWDRVEFLSDKIVFKNDTVDFGSPWHQDWSYWQGRHKVSFWVALDEATRENGCLLVVPGTHRAPIEHDLVHAREGFGHRLELSAAGIEAEPIACELPRGGAVLFHDLALHGSLPNTSGRPRRAWIPTYREGDVADLDYEWCTARRLVTEA